MCHNPDFDLEKYETFLNHHLTKEFVEPTLEEALQVKPFIHELTLLKTLTDKDLHNLLRKHGALKYKKNTFLVKCFYMLVDNNLVDPGYEDHIKDLLRIKRGKSDSGILSITVFTSPYPEYLDENGIKKTQRFTCSHDCHYCPNEPGQPRSYLKGEPGVMRANRYGFDAKKQMWGRMSTLSFMGHNLKNSKLEIIVSGGTWTSYPHQYREEFMRDIYFAANTFHQIKFGTNVEEDPRERKQLKEEKLLNKTSMCRIIGLTVEFRPDSINKKELIRLRSYGCTRVQLGVQHLDNNILKGINRRCTTERFIKSLKLLKDCCFKVDIHIMPNLPFSDIKKDMEMMDRFLGMKSPIKKTYDDDLGAYWESYDINDPEISADQWKLYPCEIVPYTQIADWYRQGTYIPYSKQDLYELLYTTKKRLYPWIRTNRIIRDIPKNYIIASSDDPNTGQQLLYDLKKNGHICMCIRCRESKQKNWNGEFDIVIRKYEASGGIEYFISAESMDRSILYGFVRLRLSNPSADIFPELENSALIRELHVYSTMCPVGSNSNNVQHRGLGKTLLSTAETISVKNGYNNVAVIAGVGVQEYYEKQGYVNDSEGQGDFMIKYL